MTNNGWYRQKRLELIEQYSGECQAGCGVTTGLEFAHVKPTECVGKGRGFNHRVVDVLRNPCAYVLLCAGCHDSLDGRPRRKRQPDIRRHL